MEVFITGVSSGIGLALAEKYLDLGHQVIGIGRRSVIKHEHYSFITCNLLDNNAVKNLTVEPTQGEVLWINNAGMLGNAQRISDQVDPDIADVMQVNALAPMYFMHMISRACTDRNLTILNISSGAANRAIPSWASYCASKIALDRFSETFYLEEKEKGRSTQVFSIAPGVVDTPMQEQIRKADPTDFSSLDSFIERYENKELRDPKLVAQLLYERLELGQIGDQVLYSI